MTSYNTKLNLSKQSKINTNEQANFDGSIAIGQNLFISGIKIDTIGAINGYVLTYDLASNTFKPLQSSGGTGSSGSTTPVNASTIVYNKGIYTNIQSYLDGNYVFPVINSFTNDINILQYGQSASTINFTWNSNKTGYQYQLNPTGGTYSSTTQSFSINNQNITGNTSNSAVTYTLTFNDGISSTNKTTNIYFYNKRYYGTNSATTLSNNDILNLNNNEFDYNISQFSLKNISGGSNYIYFCYPTREGLINMFVNGMYSNDFNITTQIFTNQFSFSESYYIIRTTNKIYSDNMYFQSR